MRQWLTAMRTPHQTVEQLLKAFAATPWGGVGDTLPLTIAEEWVSGKRTYEPDWHALVSGPGPWQFQASGNRMGA